MNYRILSNSETQSLFTDGSWVDDLDDELNWPCHVAFGARHFTEEIEGAALYVEKYYKEKIKTLTVALVICLNIDIDPPDVQKIPPFCRVEAWFDPTDANSLRALETIGKNLQKFTKYIPLSLYDLQRWLGAPSVYVFDCQNAGRVIRMYENFCHRRLNEHTMEAAAVAAAAQRQQHHQAEPDTSHLATAHGDVAAATNAVPRADPIPTTTAAAAAGGTTTITTTAGRPNANGDGTKAPPPTGVPTAVHTQVKLV
ncbi:Regulatory associated protein of mTOR [Fasciola gigantica]|uniref:Regulatory associated protein of mTOR n=1 Tax=Fasciola gigantica TaxID=46835 RepID=A0A504YB27_FASGI|nr:Regulatory associated protein of mTOR [Fasciola gigantica]